MKIPKHKDISTDPYKMGLPQNCAEIADYCRTLGPGFLVKDPNVWGVGLGSKKVKGEETGKYCIQFLVSKKLPLKKIKKDNILPKEIGFKRKNLVTDVLELPMKITSTFHAQGAGLQRHSLAYAGSAISNEPVRLANRNPSGTYGGTYRSLTGNSIRGITCAHVSIGLGIDAILAGLPGTLFDLFRSPSGERIYYSDAIQVGQPIYELMQIDTNWPMLVPWPFPLPAPILGFLYVDGDAGDVDPQTIPNNPPNFFPQQPPTRPIPRNRTIQDTEIDSPTVPLPTMQVYKLGQTTGITWGNILLSFVVLRPFQFAIGIGPIVVFFDQVISTPQVQRGDSGSPLITLIGNHYLASCWAGLGAFSLATPWYWLSLCSGSILVP